MSGPPPWLWWALAAAVTVTLAAVGVAVVSAGLDWMDRRRGRERASAPVCGPETQPRQSGRVETLNGPPAATEAVSARVRPATLLHPPDPHPSPENPPDAHTATREGHQ